MQDFLEKIQNYIEHDVKDDIGDIAQKHFKQSFMNEAFSDKSEKDIPLKEPKEVKRRMKKDKKSRKFKKNINRIRATW